MQKNKPFVDALSAQPGFTANRELSDLFLQHGDSPELLQAVIDAQIATKDDACRYWSESIGFAYVDPFASLVTEEAVAKIPHEVAKKVRAIGLYVIDGTLTLAMADPRDTELCKRLGQIARMPASPVFALGREIDDAIAVYYSTEKNLEESLVDLEQSNLFDKPEAAADKVALMAENNALTQVLDEIIYFAIRERATDIHIEAQEVTSRIRFRVDGNLREVLTFSRKLHRGVVSRIKILCNLNIAESRFPQDGRFSMPIGTSKADFRVSTIPSAYGEKVVIRILAMTGKKTIVTLDKMMMSQTMLNPFKRLIKSPHGMIFVTGPTGSGKTTTLYAALNEINSPDVNVSTIEDPIEMQLNGVNQTQVNSHIDLKFSTILRALMRQDPDAILIGEIRDVETAKIATEAALTGHVVFATLHTNSAPQAIVRLIEIGVEPYMVSPSLIGVLGQRLAPRICENCKEPYKPSPEVLNHYFHDAEGVDVTFYRGRGCPACRGTGYKGRIAFHELVLVTDEMRTLISENRSVQEISKAAAKVGYQPLRYDALKKVLMGLTTIEQVEQNTSFEWAAG